MRSQSLSRNFLGHGPRFLVKAAAIAASTLLVVVAAIPAIAVAARIVA